MFAVVVAIFILLAVGASAVPVRIIALNIIHQHKPTGRINECPIVLLETGQNWTITTDGQIILDFAPGSNLTFFMPACKGFHSVQTATVYVPSTGLDTVSTAIVIQAIPEFFFDLTMLVSPGKKNPQACQVITTVCDVNATWEAFPQGIPGATASIFPPLSYSQAFYFGVWPWSNHSNPLPNSLNSTSWDGGVLFENVPVSRTTEFVIVASKAGYTFSTARVRCLQPGSFINAAPNQGPRAIFRRH